MNVYLHLVLIILLQFTFGCSTPVAFHPEKELPNEAYTACGDIFKIAMPSGWQEVSSDEQVQKRILWSFCNYNYTVWAENPVSWAWDGPNDTDGFFTATIVKRNPSMGLGTWYGEIIQWLKSEGAVIQETGITTINNARSKWWIQSLGNGYIYQLSYMFTHGSYIYTLCFTTNYISPEKQKDFEEIAKTIRFIR